MSDTPASSSSPSAHTVGLRRLFELECEVSAPVSSGTGPGGEIRLIPILGGRFSGEALSGIVLPGGADWQSVRSDGGLEISARYLLQTQHDERIEVRSDGLRAATPEVLARLAKGELLPPDQYYFRTAVRFRTGAPRLAQLNDRLAVAYGQRMLRGVRLEVYEVL